MQRKELNLDIKKTTPIKTPDGGDIWGQGVVLRKLSKFVSGTPEDALVPIPVFYDLETKEIIPEALPKEIREEYNTINDQN